MLIVSWKLSNICSSENCFDIVLINVALNSAPQTSVSCSISFLGNCDCKNASKIESKFFLNISDYITLEQNLRCDESDHANLILEGNGICERLTTSSTKFSQASVFVKQINSNASFFE